MRTVSSYQHIVDLLNRVRDLRRGFVTNFFPDEFKVSLWIQYQMIYVVEEEDSVVFIVKKETFSALYFAAVSLESLQFVLQKLPVDCYVIDYVSRKVEDDVQAFFDLNGFIKYTALYRMSKIAASDVKVLSRSSNVRVATAKDLPYIQFCFFKYFDKFVEQIPTIEELTKWIDKKHLLVYDFEGNIGGFIIFDLSPSTWYLRYWFVDPAFRDKKIGSALLNESLHSNPKAKRQMLWVIETNENAIKRYEHFGFKREQMIDTVYINNQFR